MTLTDISILNYKNITEANLEFSPNINCFIGDNGEGKTNLLDAIYFLSFCHSMFSNIDSQMMRHEADFFMLKGHYMSDDGGTDETILASMKRGTKKTFRRNGKSYKKLSEHIGLIPLIIISPDDVSVISGGGEERRRLLDIVISQYDNTYIEYLIRYNKALAQRNVLLKSEEEPDEMLMSLWEDEMAKYGEEVYNRRNSFVEHFLATFNNIYQRISGDKEQVSLRYVSHCQRGNLLDVISRDRHKDRAVGYSLHGIHRDDLEMLINGYPIKREGSQGQTKTFVIALKLAQFEFLRNISGNTIPLLLLDDIFDKLDAKRVQKIINIVSDKEFGQIFITDTNREHLDRILAESHSDYKIFNVKKGVFS